MKNSLAQEFLKFKSKYKTKKKSIALVVNCEKNKKINQKKSQEEKTNMINDLNKRKL